MKTRTHVRAGGRDDHDILFDPDDDLKPTPLPVPAIRG